MHGFLNDIGIAVISATIIGVIAHRIRQPVILGYLIAGALIGPEIGFKLIANPQNIEIISEIGLILLLFIIGLEMDLKNILSSGRQMLIAGIGQFAFSVLIGLGFFALLGYHLKGGSIDALYLSLFCALSSTAVVVKLLYDKFELDTLHGRITVGVLIFQDIWAILILALQPNFTNPKFILIGLAILKSSALLGIGFFLSRYILKSAYEKIAKSPELVVAVSIGWCAFISGIAEFIGLSKEMGALIAGVSVATFPYSVHLTAKILPLRDFFLTLFFISLGMKIPIIPLNSFLTVFLIIIFVIVSRFTIVYPLLSLSGSSRRTCFITSLNLSQISEFSLVIAAIGVSSGHIQKNIMSLILYAMAITSVLSSYFIKFNHEIYLFFNKTIERMGFRVGESADETEKKHTPPPPVVILGFHRGARALIEQIKIKNPDLLEKILVIDFNLEVMEELKKMNIQYLFGDISSADTLKHSHLENAKVIISTIPDMLLKGTNNLKIIKTCRAISPSALIVVTADYTGQIDEFKKAGASEVILPYCLAGEYLSGYLIEIIK